MFRRFGLLAVGAAVGATSVYMNTLCPPPEPMKGPEPYNPHKGACATLDYEGADEMWGSPRWSRGLSIAKDVLNRSKTSPVIVKDKGAIVFAGLDRKSQVVNIVTEGGSLLKRDILFLNIPPGDTTKLEKLENRKIYKRALELWKDHVGAGTPDLLVENDTEGFIYIRNALNINGLRRCQARYIYPEVQPEFRPYPQL